MPAFRLTGLRGAAKTTSHGTPCLSLFWRGRRLTGITSSYALRRCCVESRDGKNSTRIGSDRRIGTPRSGSQSHLVKKTAKGSAAIPEITAVSCVCPESALAAPPGRSGYATRSLHLRGRRNDTTLRRPLGALHQRPFRRLQRRFEPPPHVQKNPRTLRVLPDCPHHKRPIQVVKETAHVQIDDPVVAPASLARRCYSSSGRFGACTCMPTPRDLPSSLVQQGCFQLAATSRPPFRAIVAHRIPRTATRH